MKKLIYSITAMLLVFSNSPVYANNTQDKSNQLFDSEMILDENDKKIEYIPKVEGYYLENITVDEVLEAFDQDPNFKNVSKKNSSIASTQNINKKISDDASFVLNAKNIDVNSVNAVYNDYEVKIVLKGIENENVVVSFTINMEITYITVSGVKYAQFVKFHNAGSAYPNNPNYIMGPGCSSPIVTILNGGATIQVEAILQLQTTKSYGVGFSIPTGWFSISGSASQGYYYRTSSKTYFGKYNLPLYNIYV